MNKNHGHIEYDSEQAEEHKYIIFYLGNELYATPLTETREVVEVLPTKSVPNTVDSFVGVCNLRGQIVGVIDLRKRFDIPPGEEKAGVYFVFDIEKGAIAARVDAIVCVDSILPDCLETKPNIVSKFPQTNIIGIAKYKDHLVTVVDLKSVLYIEELAVASHLVKKAA